MTDPNQHISEYLDYYCSMTESPEFGVLLKGEWGSGKTWFIENYFKKEDRKHLYVSLYGLSSFSEIEAEFFRQLHPLLSSKGAKLAGKILKGVLKTSLKVDLDHDGKDDGAVNSQIPDINLPEYLTDIDNCVLIFDDLERCKLDIENILGYINHFVEHQGFKVIVLAHEDELEKRVEKSPPIEYTKIKEKLIGRTFKVLPNVESAIDDFIGKLKQVGAQKFLRAQKDFVIEVYALSESNNLRVLKQSLWDFERIYDALPEKAKEVDDLVRKILGHSLSYSLDIRVGAISSADILRSDVDWISAFTGKQDKDVQKSPSQKFAAKYRKLEPSRSIPTAEFWSEFFDKGTINAAEINAAIDNSVYFMTGSKPGWVRLWYYMDLQDDELGPLLQDVWQEFERKEFVDVGVLLHVVGILLTLADMKLLRKSKARIVAGAKRNIDSLKASNKLVPRSRRTMVDVIESKTGYAGLGFHGNRLAEFVSVVEYLEKAQRKASEEMMPHGATHLLDIMKSDMTKFVRMITLSNTEDQIYCDTPIFKYLAAKTFVSALLEVTPHDRRFVMYALEERYKHDTIAVKLVDELEWLKRVKRLLGAEIKKRKGKLSAHAFQNILSAVEGAVEKLAAIKEKHA